MTLPGRSWKLPAEGGMAWRGCEDAQLGLRCLEGLCAVSTGMGLPNARP